MQKFRSRISSLVLHLNIESYYLGKHLLTLSDIEKVEEVGNGLGIVGTRSTAYDYGGVLTSVLCAKRNFCHIEHSEHVGIAHFVLKRKTDEIKA